jgi:hypothetical protein
MNKYTLILVTVIAFAFSTLAHANPGLLWGLIKKASEESIDSETWQHVKTWLEAEAEDIDWAPAGEETGRVLLQRHNPELYNHLYRGNTEAPQAPDHDPMLLRAPVRAVGLGAYDSSGIELGAGSWGAVREGVHKASQAPVAIKTLTKAKYEQRELKFPPKEAELMEKLHHPNIVRFYHAITTPEAQHLILELVRARDLYVLSQEIGIFSEEEARLIICQVMSAVECMHRAQICHRDLKPENLLVDEKRWVKVIDFGLADFFDPNGVLTEYPRSPEYAAPELLLEKPYVGPEPDIWAIAAILYDLVVGDLPFHTDQAAIDLDLVCPEDADLSKEFIDLICMAFQYMDKRCTLSQMLEHKWTKCI